MGLGIFFSEDVKNALLAANEASAATAVACSKRLIPPHLATELVTNSTELLVMNMRAYREGYKAALTTLALAFGISPASLTMLPAKEKEKCDGLCGPQSDL